MSRPNYEIERANERPGEPPTSVWMSYQIDEQQAAIALVGVYDIVHQFARKLASYGLRAPFVAILFQPEGKEVLHLPELGVFVAGLWPVDSARAVVMALSDPTDCGPMGWAKNYRRIRHDPDRQKVVERRDELARMLAQVYLQEVVRSVHEVP